MFTPVLFFISCSAPELAPQTDLAGAQPVANGPLAENHSGAPPFSAWTAATPLTLVAPGGANLAIIENLGVRVEVLQIREGRILVQCTGCTGESSGAEGWMPRGVLWTALEADTATAITATDPLTVALKNRALWAQAKNLPPNGSSDAMCAMVDHGFDAEASQAISTLGGGKIRLARKGADWSVVEFIAPNTAVTGSCG
jgi:hypothetical protein